MDEQRPEGIVTEKRAARRAKREGLAAVPDPSAEQGELYEPEPDVAGEPGPEELPTDEGPQWTTEQIAAAKGRHPADGKRKETPEVSMGHPTLEEDHEFFHVVFFGDPGKGKTTDAAAMAKLGKIVFVNSEMGLKAGPIRRMGIPLGNIEPRPSKIEREAGVEITYSWLEELAFEIKDRLASGEEIVGVVWDTGNDMYQRMLQSVVDANSGDRGGNEWAAEIGDYGDVAQAMRRMIRRYHSLDCHWAVTFHAQRAKDENGSIVVLPNLSDKLLVDMLGYVDAIIYCMADEDPADPELEEFVGFTRPTGKFFAKDRYKLLPKRLVDPTMDRVMAYLSGELVAKDDALQQAAKAKRAAKAAQS